MKFMADVMLGRLARFMRFRGYDVEYDNQARDESLLKSRRLVLTKDRKLASRIKKGNVYFVKTIGAEKQLAEIMQNFPPPAGVVRCLSCNTKIKRIPKRKIAHLIPPFIFRKHRIFYFCRSCTRIYWPGSHYERMSRMIK